jgi:cysteine desulfurase / selenocysteine lyase
VARAGITGKKTMKIEELRTYFPGLQQQCYGKNLAYLDNAATSQRLKSAVSLADDLALNHNANIHRSVYKLASDATAAYEVTRDYVKEYLNAEHREEIIFTSGTTFSINMVAHTFGDRFIGEGDNIIIGESEHHSDIVPWQLLSERKGCEIRVLPVNDEGYLDADKLPELMDEHTRLVCVAQISNVMGVINPIEKIVEIAHAGGAKVLVDGAQGIVHLKTDVRKMDCDFYAFSGHKIFAATGTGVLYAKKEILEQMPPFLGGGEMIGTVSWNKTTYADLPYKFEAGTPNFNGIPTLKSAMELLRYTQADPEIKDNLENIKVFVYQKLTQDERITLAGSPKALEDKVPLFSIIVKGVHHEDLALVMDKMGIALRSGHVCAEPLMSRLGVTGILRASFAPYNTMEEAEYFIKSLDRAINMLI